VHELIEGVVDTCMQRVNNGGIQRCQTETEKRQERETRDKKKGDKIYID
jgi:hypothetical protein